MVYVKENISKIWQNFALFNGETNRVVWCVLMSTWVGTTVPTHVDYYVHVVYQYFAQIVQGRVDYYVHVVYQYFTDKAWLSFIRRVLIINFQKKLAPCRLFEAGPLFGTKEYVVYSSIWWRWWVTAAF